MESRKKKRRWWLIVCLSPKNGKPRAVLLLRPFFSLLCLFWTLSKKYKKPTRGTEEGDAETTHTEKGKRKKKKNSAENSGAGMAPPSFFFGRRSRAAQLTVFRARLKGPEERSWCRPDRRLCRRVSLIHTQHFPMHSLCQLIFSLSPYTSSSSYRIGVPPTQTSLSQHDWLRYVNWGI